MFRTAMPASDSGNLTGLLVCLGLMPAAPQEAPFNHCSVLPWDTPNARPTTIRIALHFTSMLLKVR